MYRVKITNPWYDSKNQFFIVKVSTTWIPWYRTVKEIRTFSFQAPEYKDDVYYSKEAAEAFVVREIPTKKAYRSYRAKLKTKMLKAKKQYWDSFKEPTNKRII